MARSATKRSTHAKVTHAPMVVNATRVRTMKRHATVRRAGRDRDARKTLTSATRQSPRVAITADARTVRTGLIVFVILVTRASTATRTSMIVHSTHVEMAATASIDLVKATAASAAPVIRVSNASSRKMSALTNRA